MLEISDRLPPIILGLFIAGWASSYCQKRGIVEGRAFRVGFTIAVAMSTCMLVILKLIGMPGLAVMDPSRIYQGIITVLMFGVGVGGICWKDSFDMD